MYLFYLITLLYFISKKFNMQENLSGENKINSLVEEKNNKPESESDKELLSSFELDIVDKQYRLYAWNDSKTLSLITTDSILLATIGFIFQHCLQDTFSIIAILIAFILISISLYFSLRQVIPQGSSGKSIGDKPNIRALSGILSYNKWEDYYAVLKKVDRNFISEINARQIYGMAYNSDVSRKIIKKGIIYTLVGILFMVFSFLGVILSSADIHIMGNWISKDKTHFENVKIDENKNLIEKESTTTKMPILTSDTLLNKTK